MGDSRTKVFTLHLSGRNEVDGVECSVETLRYSMLAAQVNSWKDMLAESDDPIIHLEGGSVKFIFYLSAVVYAALVMDIELLSKGDCNVSVPSRIEWYNRLVNLSKETGLECQLLGEGRILNTITRNTAQKIKKDVTTVRLSRLLQGEIVDMGGRKSTNMHIQTSTGKPIIVRMTRQQVADLKESVIYKRRNIRVAYRYNPTTGETSDYVFQEFVPPREFDAELFDNIVKQTTAAWENIPDHVAWIRQQRGDDTP